MFLKLLWKLLDGPLAIVVGGVGLVLIVLQLAAIGVVARGQIDRAGDREVAQRTRQAATLQCLALGNRSQHAACLLQVGERGVRDVRGEARRNDTSLNLVTVGYPVR